MSSQDIPASSPLVDSSPVQYDESSERPPQSFDVTSPPLGYLIFCIYIKKININKQLEVHLSQFTNKLL